MHSVYDIQNDKPAPVRTRRDDIYLRLSEIDAQTGMSRTARECFIAASIATPFLIQLENEAATLRAELATL